MSAHADQDQLLLAERERDRRALLEAVETVPHPTLAASLQAVADNMPPALEVECVNMRLLGSDAMLHLVAASGCTPTDVRRRAFQPLHVARVREVVVSGAHDATARSLGIRTIHIAWLTRNGDTIGAIAIGSRTIRRPGERELQLFGEVVERLASRLEDVDRTDAALRTCAMSLAREWQPTEWFAEGPVARLRPRERAILELYSDGLSTAEIADMLVISRHTVRTHVKLALRRLGVHAREDAAALVRDDQTGQLL